MLMDLSAGFQLEKPSVFVPWKISESSLEELFEGCPIRKVTRGYYTVSCMSLNGLAHELGFHFHPPGGGALIELEFFRKSYADQQGSFSEFQKHLESTFGPPSVTNPGMEGFPSHVWKLKGAEVVHFVQDRFGPEEHVRIKRRR